MPLDKLGLFFVGAKTLRYKKGEIILRAHDNPAGIFYLKEGFVRLYSISETGEELTLIIFKPQDPFPITWVINDTPNEYWLDAMTACELARAPREQFREFIKSNPDVLLELTSKMLVRLGGLLRRMEYLVFGNAYQKIASIILICAERFGRPTTDGVVVGVPLTHKDIASLVGITRETASLEIKKLEKKGLISYKGRLLVVNDAASLAKDSLFAT